MWDEFTGTIEEVIAFLNEEALTPQNVYLLPEGTTNHIRVIYYTQGE